SIRRPPPRSTRFPYTTLFRSEGKNQDDRGDRQHLRQRKLRVGREERLGDVLVDDFRDAGAVAQVLVERRTAEDGDPDARDQGRRSEEHTSELQSRENLVCRLL